LPTADVLERALRATVLAAASVPAMLLRLRLDQMALQPGQGRIPFCYRQSQRWTERLSPSAGVVKSG